MVNLCASVLKCEFLSVKLCNMNVVTTVEQTFQNKQLGLLLAYLQMQNYRFTSISPASHEKVNNRPENAIANNLVDIFGWNRPFKRETISDTLFDLMQSANIAIQVNNGWKSALRVSSINEQLFLHSAYPTIGNEAVFFGPDTYRFANAIHHFLIESDHAVYKVVDIGTGSGVGAVLLALSLPEVEPKSEIVAIDINIDALNLARVNVDAANLNNIELIQSDLLSNVKGNFDLIIANPPYLLDQLERTYRHGGGRLGAALSLAIVDAAIQRLNAGGSLLLYTGVAIVDGHDAFLAEVALKLKCAGFTFQYTEIDPDIFGEELLGEAYSMADRIAAVVLTAKKQTQQISL